MCWFRSYAQWHFTHLLRILRMFHLSTPHSIHSHSNGNLYGLLEHWLEVLRHSQQLVCAGHDLMAAFPKKEVDNSTYFNNHQESQHISTQPSPNLATRWPLTKALGAFEFSSSQPSCKVFEPRMDHNRRPLFLGISPAKLEICCQAVFPLLPAVAALMHLDICQNISKCSKLEIPKGWMVWYVWICLIYRNVKVTRDQRRTGKKTWSPAPLAQMLQLVSSLLTSGPSDLTHVEGVLKCTCFT